MQRRKFLKAGVVGAAAAATLSTPAIAQDKREWKMVTAWPKNLPGPGVAAQLLADRITTLSGETLVARLNNGTVVLTDQADRQVLVTQTDIDTSNGVIHVLDRVLLPTG